ncbi:MAG: mannose-6-phosphate isomerase, class I [Ruminococcus sp.]|nr:mannose-6-phosphate isomerase, class I [Ruminococcus sp.]
MEIMKLSPSVKNYIWGGTRLITEYGKGVDGTERISETWECSVHQDGESVVVSGEYKGKTLGSVIEMHPEYLGKNNRNGFPVLIKFIDAGKDLSIQVHPDDEYARVHEGQNGKSEMWYVMEAEEGATLVYGFEHDVTAEEVCQALGNGRITDFLHYEKIKKGDLFFIPSGTVHAIGKGTVIAEIQENSNVTYRVYDYDRTDGNGLKRELHTEKALDVMNLSPTLKKNFHDDFYDCGKYSRKTLCVCDYFRTEKIDIRESYFFEVGDDSFQVLLCIDGSAVIKSRYGQSPVLKGECFFIPSGMGKTEIHGSAEFLKVSC